MKDDLLDKDYRQAFVEENVKTGIAFQTRALRLKKDWSQKELGDRAGKPQNVISRLENPDYGNFTLRTLLDLAAAFDVALLVRFVSFGQLFDMLKDVSNKALAVPSFEKEMETKQAALDGLVAGAAAARAEESQANRQETIIFRYGGTQQKRAADAINPLPQFTKNSLLPEVRALQ